MTIYTLSGCRHSLRAKLRLWRNGIAFEEIPCSRPADARRRELRERFGVDTFPQILIGGRHVGGADELAALDRRGELDRLAFEAARPVTRRE